MHQVSLPRLYGLRAAYLLVVVGLGASLWPGILDPARHWALFEGTSTCMLAAYSLLCLVGLRHPLRMLPLLVWEVIWKTLWLALVPLPQWWAGHVDDTIKPTLFACSLVVLFYLAIPWRYVLTHHLTNAGDRWWTKPDHAAAASPHPA